MFGQVGQKGDNVMLGHSFDFIDARDVELDIFCLPNRLRVFARDHAQIGHRVAGVRLDLKPDAEFRLGGPDGDHVGAGITGDHRLSSLALLRLGVSLRVRSGDVQHGDGLR